LAAIPAVVVPIASRGSGKTTPINNKQTCPPTAAAAPNCG
jgi:hypothetical protein